MKENMHHKKQNGTQKVRDPHSELEQNLISVFVQLFGIAPEMVHPDLRQEEVKQWDSMGYVTLVAAIEEAFSISLDIDEIIEMTSFRAALAVLEKKLCVLGIKGDESSD